MARGAPSTLASSRRRGVILVTALWIIVILSSVILVLARSMRVESIAAKNRVSALEADAIERGAEQYVLSQVEGAPGDPITVLTASGEAVPVGDGYFWLLRADPTTDQLYGFGVQDESAKVNLNSAKSEELAMLPGMTPDVADAIIDWRDPDDNSSGNGAESDYYLSLPQPYSAKNAPFETVEELKLIKGMTLDLLYGQDPNRDGVIDTNEQSTNSNGISSGGFSGVAAEIRGIINYVTCYSVEPNKTVDGKARINVNSSDTAPLKKVIDASITDKNRATAIVSAIQNIIARAGGGGGGKGGKGGTPTITKAFANIGDFYLKSTMKPDEFSLLVDQITTSTAKTLTGLVNVNTAPKEVLMALPGNLSDGDADNLVTNRANADTTSFAWIFTAIDPAKAAGIAGNVTTRSFVYSADIVAVSGDGRAFKRVRVVIDATKLPAKIVYRRDITGLGWPLDRGIQDDLRAGRYQAPALGSNNGSNPVTGGSGIR